MTKYLNDNDKTDVDRSENVSIFEFAAADPTEKVEALKRQLYQ